MRLALGDIPTAASCLPYQCGADSSNISAIYACAVAGYSGALSCDDPQCEPYCPNQNLAPTLAPPYQPPATPSAPSQPTTVLTPASIVQPFPDITRTLQPIVASQPCDWWQTMNGDIAANTLLSVAALAGLFLLAFGGKK
jgi:hypothetical protein